MHLSGVVHRDIKPANFALDPSGYHLYILGKMRKTVIYIYQFKIPIR